MLQQLLREAVVAGAGVGAGAMADQLFGKENVNEFDIAGKLKLTINQTRNLLYKLADHGLVSFTRKKDKKNGGWYTYFWTLNSLRSLEFLKKKLQTDMEQQEQAIQSKQTKRFYYCKNCDVEMSEENALLNDFACPECGEVLVLRDNSEAIVKLQQEMVKMRAKVGVIDTELNMLYEKATASNARKIKREEKKKKALRAAKRAEKKSAKPVKKEKVKKSKATAKKPKKSKSQKRK